MNIKEILNATDHTNLNPCATYEDIERLCNEAIKAETASVCIAPSNVSFVKRYFDTHCQNTYRPKICTVIGFPHGNITTGMKMNETIEAICRGADEIDMVINLGWVKNRQFELVLSEIDMIKECCGDRILKVIIETCFLTAEEKVILCHLLSSSSADYIKTSTGYGTGGATVEDIELFKEHINRPAEHPLKIKASGGIYSLEEGEKFLKLGVDRLGASKIVKDAIEKGCIFI